MFVTAVYIHPRANVAMSKLHDISLFLEKPLAAVRRMGACLNVGGAQRLTPPIYDPPHRSTPTLKEEEEECLKHF